MVDIMNQAALERNRKFGRRMEFFFLTAPFDGNTFIPMDQ